MQIQTHRKYCSGHGGESLAYSRPLANLSAIDTGRPAGGAERLVSPMGGEEPMRRLGAWGVGTSCLIGLAMAAGSRAGGLPPGGGGKPAAVRPMPGPPTTVPEPVRSAVQQAAQTRQREEAAYLRRVAVCDKLTAVAFQTNDAPLEEMAEQLRQRAFDV